MKNLITTILLLVSATLFSQETSQVNIYSNTLNIGEMLVFGDKSLKFKNVVSDSRCPTDVTCVWAGEAIITVEVFENGNFIEEKVINVQSSNIPLNFSVENILYNITGLHLSPYPSVRSKNHSEVYVLRMNVSEMVKG